MTLMKSRRHTPRLAVAGFEPVGWGQRDGLFGHHAGQAGEHVGEVSLGIDTQAPAALRDGVEDDTLLTRLLVAEEQPVFGSQLGRADRVFDEVVAKFPPGHRQDRFRGWAIG
jgi:hypothetical protein